MNKSFISLLLTLNAAVCFGQITFEQQYPNILGVIEGPVLIEIAPEEQKYLVQNRSAGTFSLFNLDHTPFLEDVDALVPLYQEPFNYEPVLISRSLFDCDPASIEFAVATAFPLVGATFIIQRTDGTEIFNLDGATLPYCFGCAVGTRIDQAVYNTAEGTKMILMQNEGVLNSLTYRIYGLCGTLPNGLREYGTSVELSAWPNPSGDGFTIAVPPEAGSGPHRLEVYDGTGARVSTQTFSGGSVLFDAEQLAPGTYYPRIVTASRTYATRLVRIHR